MKVFRNEFSWSKSRDELFKECRRKYYYHHYASWGGWNRDADPRTREIYMLKNLQNLHMWIGDKVHSTIEFSLKCVRKEGRLPSKARLLSIMAEDMHMDFNQSKAGLYRKNPKYYHGFFEHEYQVDVDRSKWDALRKNATICIDNYYNSYILTEALEIGPENWMPIESRASFNFLGTPVYVKVDFAYKKNGRLIIVDWKTGRTEDVDLSIQIGCYALYALRKWKAKISKIDTIIYNLLRDRFEKTEMIEARISEAEFHILTSIEAMKKQLACEKENIPLPEEQFPKTSNRKNCNYCNFQRICHKK